MRIEYRPPFGLSTGNIIHTAINTAKKLNNPVRFTIDDQCYEVTPNMDPKAVHQEYEEMKDEYKPSVYIFQEKYRTTERIRQWVRDRNLHTADPKVQLGKLLEEAGEVAHAVMRDDKNRTMDGIGDVIVVLICIAEQLDLNIDECIEMAYNEIKDRKGRLIDGVFVKEEDL